MAILASGEDTIFCAHRSLLCSNLVCPGVRARGAHTRAILAWCASTKCPADLLRLPVPDRLACKPGLLLCPPGGGVSAGVARRWCSAPPRRHYGRGMYLGAFLSLPAGRVVLVPRDIGAGHRIGAGGRGCPGR